MEYSMEAFQIFYLRILLESKNFLNLEMVAISF